MNDKFARVPKTVRVAPATEAGIADPVPPLADIVELAA